jgi:hypothetical protein
MAVTFEIRPFAEIPDDIDFTTGRDNWGEGEAGRYYIDRTENNQTTRWFLPPYLNHMLYRECRHAREVLQSQLCALIGAREA